MYVCTCISTLNKLGKFLLNTNDLSDHVAHNLEAIATLLLWHISLQDNQ